MRLRTAASTLLLLVALVPSTFSNGEILEEIIEQKYPINPTAKFTLKNGDGSVRIYGAEEATMTLQAIKKAYSKDRLGKIDVNIAVEPDAVSIDTKYPPTRKWALSDRSGTVDYVIILPWYCDLQRVELRNGEMLIEGMRGNEVHAELGNGRLFGHNCFTDLHLSIANGDVDVAYDWWETHSIALDTNITQGSARLFIPGDAQFRLHAEALNGHIFNDFSGKEERAAGGETRLDLSVGGGANAEMKVRAGDGSIKIKELYP